MSMINQRYELHYWGSGEGYDSEVTLNCSVKIKDADGDEVTLQKFRKKLPIRIINDHPTELASYFTEVKRMATAWIRNHEAKSKWINRDFGSPDIMTLS